MGPWLKDHILLIDLGYFKYLFFDRIDRYGGYFVSRLKRNANPLIIGVNRKWRGNSIDVVGKKLRDVLPVLKREILDVEVEAKFKRRKYRRKQSTVNRRFRMVCIFNSESGEYHTYLSNISAGILSAEVIALLWCKMGDRTGIQGVEKSLSHGSNTECVQRTSRPIINRGTGMMGLKLDMLTLYDIYLGQGYNPNVKRERLMER